MQKLCDGNNILVAVILLCPQNMLEKPEDRSVIQDYALALVRVKMTKQLELLEARKWEDPDVEEDIQYIRTKLDTSVQDLRFVAVHLDCVVYVVVTVYSLPGLMCYFVMSRTRAKSMMDGMR